MVPLSGDATESGVKKLLKYSFHWDTCAELLLLLVLGLQLIALKKKLVHLRISQDFTDTRTCGRTCSADLILLP